MEVHPRKTLLKIEYGQSYKDISEYVMEDILSFTYDDKETNEADEISLTLKDPDGKWAGTWKPEGGEYLRAFIIPNDLSYRYKQLYCGLFYVDNLAVSGSPRLFEIRAVSIPLNKPIRKKLKSKAWEKKTLKGIAQEIADASKIKLIFDSSENPSYDRQDQSRESDLKFLSRLCEEAGLSLKLTNEKIVIFDQASYEKKTPIKTIELGVSDIKSWDFESSQSETYKTCTVTYRDPKKKVKGSAAGYNMDLEKESKKKENPAVLTYTATDPNADENGQEYALKKRAKSLEEAKRLAKAKLRSLNKRRVTGNISLVGDVSLVAGVVIRCKGFGSFDGNFIIEQASHSVDNSSGYNTSIALRRVNSNY